MALEVFSKLMNTMLIEVLSEKIHASDKALCGYLCFHRWLLYFAQQYPELIQIANETVQQFIDDESNRHKSKVPSLGEFLPLLSLSDFTWDHTMDAYLSENIDRNVFWVLRKAPDFIGETYQKNCDSELPSSLSNSKTRQFFNYVTLGSSYIHFLLLITFNLLCCYFRKTCCVSCFFS